MTVKSCFVYATAIFVLSGCTARSLSNLQTQFNATVKTEKECKNQTAATDPSASPCSADFDAIFADIADQAEKSLKEYDSNDGIKIALHRLHAYALWQSGASEQVVASSARQGWEKCAGNGFQKAPRDCALLTLVGSFKAIEGAGRKVAKVEEALKPRGRREEICKNHAAEWDSLTSGLMRNNYLPLADDVKRLARRGGATKSSLTYLQQQLSLIADQALKLSVAGEQCVPDPANSELVRDCPCRIDNRGPEDVETCAKVAENEVFAFYHNSFCASQDIFQSLTCPCGYEEMREDELKDRQAAACDYVKSRPNSKKLLKSRCAVEGALK
jgi:hypothetical protein